MTERSSVDLSGLFAPSSVAVIGASDREGRPGNSVLRALQMMGPAGAVFPITPRYDQILGLPCYPDLASAPDFDLVVIASASERIESELESAAARGARGAVVFGAPVPGEGRAAWIERVANVARAANLALLGPDSLGFVNFEHRVAATWSLPEPSEAGGIAVISQSGTVFWEANTNDPRLRFSFTGHSGLEATLSMADLVRYSLGLPSTRVVGLYVETIRDAESFVEALELAADRGVPIVALYAGRTAQSRAQMMTHAGRLAGDRAVLEGLFRHYGVVRAESPDDWWTTLAVLGAQRPLADGGVAAVMDSGGGLAMFLDFAAEFHLPLAQLLPETTTRLHEVLGIEHATTGALDFWIGESDRHSNTSNLLQVLAEDPGTAAVMAFTTYAETPRANFAINVANAVRAAHGATTKPVFAATYTSRQVSPSLMLDLAADGIPLVDGMRAGVRAMRHAVDVRDFRSRWRHHGSSSDVDVEAVRPRLSRSSILLEADALSVLGDIGVPVVPMRRAATEDEAVKAAGAVGYPVVVKTDEGITHKAALGGVRLGLVDEDAVRSAYRSMADSLGPCVIVAPMRQGLEVALGVVSSEFGPVLMMSAGGVMIEALSDRAYLLAPASPGDVSAALADLAVWRVATSTLSEAARESFCALASRVSEFADAARDLVRELDINPVLMSEEGCVAIDALIGIYFGAKED
ncbi:MAG TPA: acetate--CoA ligase family protein [Candidatus Saccharimonadales bacterium]|nr:acetate--CoA ligase family protein [Candidatus Saccharimonadales bacterium]